MGQNSSHHSVNDELRAVWKLHKLNGVGEEPEQVLLNLRPKTKGLFIIRGYITSSVLI